MLLFVDIELLLLTQGENRKMKGPFIISFYLLLSEYLVARNRPYYGLRVSYCSLMKSLNV